jgi:hypothetical protein
VVVFSYNLLEAQKMSVLDLIAEVGKDGKVHLDLPAPVKKGNVKVHVEMEPTKEKLPGTCGDLLRSPLFGIWKDRKDITDSVAFARELRRKAEQRARD